jgi:crotonobetainyl-CoA:carnitine CoA-transferase CaiB-like acyl-CoA transferase
VIKASPGRRRYRCADSAYVRIECENEAHWRALARCVGRPELAYPGDWEAARAAAPRGRLGRLLESLFEEDAQEIWIRRLLANEVPCEEG